MEDLKNFYSNDNRINNYLKLLEKEIIEIQKYFYVKDIRYFEKGFNFRGKKSIQNYIRYGKSNITNHD